MEIQKFENDDIYLPCTMQGFEDLTNEVLLAVNNVVAPNFLSADYLAQILMSAIHALDHKHGRVKKSDLFDSCINRISCHITFHAVEEIQKKLKLEHAKNNPQSLEVVPDQPVEH